MVVTDINKNLETVLLSQVPELKNRLEIVENLTILVREYEIDWYVDRNLNQVCFLIKDIARVRNSHPRSMRNAWESFKRKNLITNCPIPPTYRVISGKDLSYLKLSSPQLSIPNTTSKVNVGNWTLLYAFCIDPTFASSQEAETPIKLPHLQEEEIQGQLLHLSAYTRNPFTIEYPVKDTQSNTVKTRRFDLVRKKDKKVFIYEIKAYPLEYLEVAQTVAEKAYLELAQANFNTQVEFIFTAPTITQEASRLIRQLGLDFISIFDLARELKEEIIETSPKDNLWFYKSRVWDKFSLLNLDIQQVEKKQLKLKGKQLTTNRQNLKVL